MLYLWVVGAVGAVAEQFLEMLYGVVGARTKGESAESGGLGNKLLSELH